MLTRISFAEFGILFAVLLGLGAVAHAADRTREACGKVGKITATEITRGSRNTVELFASVQIDGGEFHVKPELAQLALAAKAAGQRVCVSEKIAFTGPSEDVITSTTFTTTLTIEDEVQR